MRTRKRPFELFQNPIFVETGSYMGDGIQAALDAGFQEIYSFEIKKELYEFCKKRFFENPKVCLIYGSSYDQLGVLLSKLDPGKKITFWLDGHFSQGDTSFDSRSICPLLQELKQIASFSANKTHTILIDDVRLMKPSTNKGLDSLFDLSVEKVKNAVLNINQNYNFAFLDGYVAQDIMAATVL